VIEGSIAGSDVEVGIVVLKRSLSNSRVLDGRGVEGKGISAYRRVVRAGGEKLKRLNTKAVFWMPVVSKRRALVPTAVLELPVVSLKSEAAPTDVFQKPVVRLSRAS
jgi:hypothetical protein